MYHATGLQHACLIKTDKHEDRETDWQHADARSWLEKANLVVPRNTATFIDE